MEESDLHSTAFCELQASMAPSGRRLAWSHRTTRSDPRHNVDVFAPFVLQVLITLWTFPARGPYFLCHVQGQQGLASNSVRFSVLQSALDTRSGTFDALPAKQV